MMTEVADGLSLLDRVKIQAEVLVPVLRRLRSELGAERAAALVADACVTGNARYTSASRPKSRARRAGRNSGP